jgi:hypothetical protein
VGGSAPRPRACGSCGQGSRQPGGHADARVGTRGHADPECPREYLGAVFYRGYSGIRVIPRVARRGRQLADIHRFSRRGHAGLTGVPSTRRHSRGARQHRETPTVQYSPALAAARRRKNRTSACTGEIHWTGRVSNNVCTTSAMSARVQTYSVVQATVAKRQDWFLV